VPGGRILILTPGASTAGPGHPNRPDADHHAPRSRGALVRPAGRLRAAVGQPTWTARAGQYAGLGALNQGSPVYTL
jgi:hypothetical protein